MSGEKKCDRLDGWGCIYVAHDDDVQCLTIEQYLEANRCRHGIEFGCEDEDEEETDD